MRLLPSLAIAVTLLGSVRAHAEDGVLPAAVVADLVRKVAPYERGHAKRIEDGFSVAVVFAPESDSSRAEKDLVTRSLEERLAGARVIAVPLSILGKEPGVDLIVVCEGIPVQEAASIAAELGVLAIGLRPEHVAVESGLAMGLVARGGKPKILVNMKAAERGRLAIDARLLGLAELVDEPSTVSSTAR